MPILIKLKKENNNNNGHNNFAEIYIIRWNYDATFTHAQKTYNYANR